MAWTTPATYTTGQVLTAASLNTNLRDNTNYLHSPPGCLAQRTTSQSIANNSLTPVAFTGVDLYDNDTMHDPAGAPNDVAINTAGVYLITASLQFAGNGTGARWMAITCQVAPQFDFGGAKDSGPTAGINSTLVASVIYKTTVTPATLGVVVQQTSGGALNITNATTTTLSGNTPVIQFGAQWISDGS